MVAIGVSYLPSGAFSALNTARKRSTLSEAHALLEQAEELASGVPRLAQWTG